MPQPDIRILQPGDEPLLEAFLLPRLESSMFLLGNMRGGGLADRGERLQGAYFAAMEGARVVAVAAHYWHGSVILQAPDHLTPLLRAVATHAVRPVKGFIGPDDQVGAAAALWSMPLDGTKVQMNSREGLYALTLDHLLVPPALAQGRVCARRIEARDIPLMVRWRIAYSIEALGAKDGPELREKCQTEIEAMGGLRRLWVLESEDGPVGCAALNAAVPEAVQIGGVWTPPESRGRGYARCVVAASLLDVRAEGVRRAILFTGDDNPAAIRAYTALGFHRIGDYRLLLLHEPHPPAGALLLNAPGHRHSPP